MTNQLTDLVLLVIAAKDSGTWYLGKSGTEHGLPSSALHTQAMSNQLQIYNNQLLQICAAANHWTETSFRLSDRHELVLSYPDQTPRNVLVFEVYIASHYEQDGFSPNSLYKWVEIPRINNKTRRGETRGSLPIVIWEWLGTKNVPPLKNPRKAVEA